MPIVEYTCPECKHTFDEIVLSREDITEEFDCPVCDAKAIKKDFPSSHGFNATDLARARN